VPKPTTIVRCFSIYFLLSMFPSLLFFSTKILFYSRISTNFHKNNYLR
jgi:hypothetical protein